MNHTLDSWRPGRDNDGWKIFTRELIIIAEEEEKVDIFNDIDAPNTVLPVSRFKNNLEALSCILEDDLPSRSTVRLKKTGWVSNGIGDASGVGYGENVRIESNLHFRYEQWVSSVCETSSNYRELRNLIDTVERLYNDKKNEKL